MPVEIKRTMSVYGGGSDKVPWVIDAIEVIDGEEFVRLSAKDAGFLRFVFGSSRGRQTSRFLMKLKELRTLQTIECMTGQGEKAGASLFDDADVKAPSRRADKRRRDASKAALSRTDIPAIVVVTHPELQLADGSTIPQCDIKMKAELDGKQALCVHIEPATLDFIRHGMAVTEPDGRRPASTVANVHWRVDRGAYIARSTNGKRMKTFKPDGDDESSIKDALGRAADWLASAGDEQ